MTRAPRVAVASVVSAAATVGVAGVLGAPASVLVIVALVSLAVFVLGYSRSPFFARHAPGPPCPRCGGLGYRAEAHAFHLRRDPCPACRGRGTSPGTG